MSLRSDLLYCDHSTVDQICFLGHCVPQSVESPASHSLARLGTQRAVGPWKPIPAYRGGVGLNLNLGPVWPADRPHATFLACRVTRWNTGFILSTHSFT